MLETPKSITKLDKDIILEDSSHSVFISIIARNKYKISKSIIREIPAMLLILRKDGRIGFPGGKLEKKDMEDPNGKVKFDDLKRAIIREVKEEIGYEIIHPEYLKLESSYLVNTNQISNFIYFVSEDELYRIYKEFYNTVPDNKFFIKEILGLNLFYIESKQKLESLLQHHFKATTAEEISNIVKNYFYL